MSRNSMLSQIHIAKKDLGMDDETYRAMLESLIGKLSCAKASDRQLALVLGHLRRQGWVGEAPRKAGHVRPRAKPGCGQLMGKIEALLAASGRPWGYAASLAKRMYGMDSLEWCGAKQLGGIIAALAKDAERRARRAAGQGGTE